MKKLIKAFTLSFLLLSFPAWAIVPTPAGPQTNAIAITGATIHTGNGDVIENGVITFTGGKITGVFSADATYDLEDHQVIEMKNKHLYPGFVLPNTMLGLVEVNSVRATLDVQERGALNPSVRSIVAYNTDSELIPSLRFNGILTAQITPRGSLIGGLSSIVQLDAWNWEDAALTVDDGIHLYWPAMHKRVRDSATRTTSIENNENYTKRVMTLERLFQNAAVYNSNAGLNLKLAAIRRLNAGKTKLYIHADGSREIISAIRFARRQNVSDIVLVGGLEALNVKDFLIEHKVPVIVDRIHGLPDSVDADIDQSYSRPAQLIKAGLIVGMGTYSDDPMASRNLPFMAGTAVAYGLDKEAALTMITRTNAEILGIAHRLGTLETGKDATLFVSEGDALDMRGNQLLRVFIQGRDVNLNGTQQQLFERYRQKYSAPGS